MNLRRFRAPDEQAAQERAWNIVRAAYAEREPVTWPRRHARSVVLAAAGAVLVAAAVTPPGRSVVNTLRDAVGREKVVGVRNAHRELVRLPAPGQLLVNSARGPWVVAASSRRRLGAYRMASWSPHGLFVAATNGYELLALDPKGNVRWSIGRKQRLAFPRWSSEGYRIAYFADDTVRVITGDGVKDWGLGSADPRVAPAWRPATHDLAYVGIDGAVRVRAADSRTLLWRVRVSPDTARSLAWSDDGRLLLVVGATQVHTYRAAGTLVAASATTAPATAAAFEPHSHRFALIVGPGVILVDGDTLRFPHRELFSGTTNLRGIAWSPDGGWLLVGWPGADQLVFVRLKPPKLVAVSNVAGQFLSATFPTVAGWAPQPTQ
jgi:hypothetical protein